MAILVKGAICSYCHIANVHFESCLLTHLEEMLWFQHQTLFLSLPTAVSLESLWKWSKYVCLNIHIINLKIKESPFLLCVLPRYSSSPMPGNTTAFFPLLKKSSFAIWLQTTSTSSLNTDACAEKQDLTDIQHVDRDDSTPACTSQPALVHDITFTLH